MALEVLQSDPSGPQEEPVISSGYTDDQVFQALQESMRQGFSLEQSTLGAATKYGIPQAQLQRVQGALAAATPVATTPTSPSAPGALTQASAVPTKTPSSIADQFKPAISQIMQGNVPWQYDEQESGAGLGYTTIGDTQIQQTRDGGYEISRIAADDRREGAIYDREGNLIESYFTSEIKPGQRYGGTRMTFTDAQGNVRTVDNTPSALIKYGPEIVTAAASLMGAPTWLMSGINTAARGGNLEDLAKNVALSYVGSAAGDLTSNIAGKAASAVGGGLPGQIVSGAVKGAASSVPGALATGDFGKIGVGALTGGATAGASSVLSDAAKSMDINVSQKQVTSAINLARAISSGSTTGLINAAAGLIDNPNVDVAAKAYTLIKAIESKNPVAIGAASKGLSSAVKASDLGALAFVDASRKFGSSPAEAKAVADAITRPIVGQVVDPSTLPAESDIRTVGLRGTLGDQAGDYPGQSDEPKMYDASGQMIVAPKGKFITLPDGRWIDDQGFIYNQDNTFFDPRSAAGSIASPATTAPSASRSLTPIESVDVTGAKSPTDIALDYFFDDKDVKVSDDSAPSQRVEVTDKKVPEVDDVALDYFFGTVDDSAPGQRVDIVGEKLPEEDIPLQTVDIVGEKLPKEDIPPQTVDIVGERLPEEDIPPQTVDIVGEKLPKEEEPEEVEEEEEEEEEEDKEKPPIKVPPSRPPREPKTVAPAISTSSDKEPSYTYKPTSPEESWLGGTFRSTPTTMDLASLVAALMPTLAQQEQEATSALQRAAGIEPPRESFFSYGTEPSPYDVMGEFRKGGNVQMHMPDDKMQSPLMMASGKVAHKGSHYVQGAGGGQDDLIPAKLADGEYVFDAEIVAALGDGSNKEGARKLDAMREAIRKHKRSGSVKSIPPKAKSPLQYLKEATK